MLRPVFVSPLPATAPAVRQPVPQANASAAGVPRQRPAAPKPTVRAQAPDEATASARPMPVSGASRELLRIPSPEQLGILRPAVTKGDSPSVQSRLDRLGALCSKSEKLAEGGYRFVCLLPSAKPQRHHRVEAVAPTEAEALRLAVERSEQWAGAH
jgi:hypothetical protein